MNRRKFIGLSLAGLLAAYLPRMENEMQLGDIWEKIANNARLTGEELAFLKHAGNETQQRNSFVGGNTTAGGALNVPVPFFPIYSEVLQKDMASLTIPIPGGYKHLLIFANGRVNGTGGAAAASIFIRFNNDTGSNYMWSVEGQYNGGNVLSQDTSDPSGILCAFVADGSAAGHSGSTFSFVPHYASSFYKYCMSLNAYTEAAKTYNTYFEAAWLNTSPIVSITLLPDTTTYPSALIVAGSLISVYGIQ